MAGFDMATISGPLCEEPIIGVCYIVESFGFIEDLENKES